MRPPTAAHRARVHALAVGASNLVSMSLTVVRSKTAAERRAPPFRTGSPQLTLFRDVEDVQVEVESAFIVIDATAIVLGATSIGNCVFDSLTKLFCAAPADTRSNSALVMVVAFTTGALSFLTSPANATLEHAAAMTAITKTDLLMKHSPLLNGGPAPPHRFKLNTICGC